MGKTWDESDVARFMSKVSPEPNTGCWLWLGGLSPNGYGQFSIKGIPVGAHRFVVMMQAGTTLPRDIEACHRCDIPWCVNPDHIFPGTARDNARDRQRKGRGAPQHGHHNPMSKLTTSNVLEILARRANGETQESIAKDYGINRTLVSRLEGGKRWPHILKAR